MPILLFSVRQRNQPKLKGNSFKTIKEAFEFASGEQSKNPKFTYVIEWNKQQPVRVVDVDWHGIDPPDSGTVNDLMQFCPITPKYWWLSKGGGIHLVYEDSDSGITATQLSGAAALYFLNKSKCSEVEVLTSTSAPFEDYKKSDRSQHGDLYFVKGWLKSGGVDPSQIDNYLNKKGWSEGQRLSHEDCPEDPRPNSKGGVPVQIREEGIQCWVCDEFFPWSRILDIPTENLNKVYSFVKARVPWNNVEPYFQKEFGDRAKRPVLRAIYEAALVSYYGSDHPYIKPIIYRDPRLLRGTGGQWLSSTTLEPQSDELKLAFRGLPCCQYAKFNEETKEWKVKTDQILLREHIAKKHKLKGWPEYRPQSGAPLYHFHNVPKDDVLRISLPDVKYPKYQIYDEGRMNIEEAWSCLERSFPGVNRTYLETLLILKGVAEACETAPPVLFVDGPSGSGKTVTAMLAAEIIGARAAVTMPHLSADPAKIQRAIGEHLERGCGWIVLDEFGKGLSKRGVEQISNSVLLTESKLDFTALYRGQVTVPFNAPLILTNTSIPEFITEDIQLSRRIRYVSLDRKVPDWRQTAGSVSGWRERTQQNRKVCEVIYSSIIDNWFGPSVEVSQIFDLLEVPTVLDKFSAEDNKTLQAVKRFFFLVCTQEAPSGGYWVRSGDKGWRTIKAGWDETDDLKMAWYKIYDKKNKHGVPRAISGLDLASELNLKCPAELKIDTRGQQIAFRFVSKGVKPQSKNFLFNRDLLEDPGSLPDRSELVDTELKTFDSPLCYKEESLN